MNFPNYTTLPVLFACASLLQMGGFSDAHSGHELPEGGTIPSFFLAQLDVRPAGSPDDRSAAAPGSIHNVVTTSTADGFRFIKSNGWPDHAPGQFPRRGNPNTARPQSYSFRVPLNPKAAREAMRTGGWWWGVAINGVPFEPGTAETWNNDPRSKWRYEAATGFLNLGLDEHNAHVQPTGAYHYHALPTGLVDRLGGDGKGMLLIGWAADGYPVYSGWGYTDPMDPRGPLKRVKTSYRLKEGARPLEENGPPGNYDGRFTEDFEYVQGSGDLDECNGRIGVTPEYPKGTYHYYVTTEFPFIGRLFHGEPDPSFRKAGGPPGAGPGREGFPGGANGPGGFTPPLLRALDQNGDGEIDSDEMARASDALRTLDRNGDGKLSPAEFRPSGPPPRP